MFLFGLFHRKYIIVVFCILCFAFFSLYVLIPKLVFQVKVENMVLNVGDTFDNQFEATFWGVDVTDSVQVQQNIFNARLGNYEVTYTYHDGKRVYKSVKTIKIKDQISPEIVLKGNEEIMIEKGNFYEEAGYYALDNYDGNITDSVMVNGKVDSNHVGDYFITYTVVDSSNNKVDTKRKVTVVDELVQVHSNED